MCTTVYYHWKRATTRVYRRRRMAMTLVLANARMPARSIIRSFLYCLNTNYIESESGCAIFSIANLPDASIGAWMQRGCNNSRHNAKTAWQSAGAMMMRAASTQDIVPFYHVSSHIPQDRSASRPRKLHDQSTMKTGSSYMPFYAVTTAVEPVSQVASGNMSTTLSRLDEVLIPERRDKSCRLHMNNLQPHCCLVPVHSVFY